MKKLIIVAITILLISCEEKWDLFRTFIIPQGKHYSTPRIMEALQSETLSFVAVFDESAIYDLHDPYLQSNKNKLYGFADCNSQHQENSARFAWQWFNDHLEIWAYCYVNGERIEKFISIVDINTENEYKIQLTKTSYIFTLNDVTEIVERGNVCNTGVYYKLWPYFGGSVPAPHKVSIKIKDLY